MERIFALNVFGFLVISSGSQNITRPTYLITAPEVLHPGVPVVLSVSVFTQSPIRVTAEIFNGHTRILSANASHPFMLEVKGYVKEREVLNNRTVLEFRPRRSATFIQTDKSNYKPGQVVKIRVVSIYPDGKPNKSKVNVVIKDPKGHMIQRWLSLESFLGVVSKEFQLSENPPLGMWTIEASTIFFLCFKYTYGKPVRGIFTLLIESEYFSMYKTSNKSKEINGSADFEFTKSDFNLSSENSYNEVILHITACVTESLTGLKSNASVEVMVVQNKYNLMFYGYSHQLKPSLNFSAYLKISTYNMKPLTLTDQMKNVTLTITQNKYSEAWDYWLLYQNQEFNISFSDNQSAVENRAKSLFPSKNMFTQTISLPVPVDGIVPIQFQLLDYVQFLSIKAFFENSHEFLWLSTNYFSTSNSYLQLRRASFPQQGSDAHWYGAQEIPAQVGVPLPLIAHSNFPLTELHYLVKSRGQVVAAGKETSASFSLNPEDDWTPLASIIVYTIHTTGEVVSDVLQVPISKALKNNVSLSWSQARAKPAEKVELKVSVSEPGSLVGVLVVDKAAQLAKPNNGIDMDEVLEKLMEFSTEKVDFRYTEMDDDAFSIFTKCNLKVLTDTVSVRVLPLYQHMYLGLGNELATMMREDKQEQEPQVRRDFPETWLWLDANMSESTTKHLSLTAPDSITSWIATAFVMSDNLGLGLIETPSKLTVFQNFFISLNLPAYIIRGEQLVLEVNLFNYLDRKLEVTVIVVQNSSFEFVLEKQVFGSNMRTVFVERQDSASVLFPIRPKVLGEISISVKAVSNIASDAIIRKVLVKPEGVEQTFTKTLFLELAPSSNALYQEIMFTFPEDVVEGSERAHVTVVGDVLGQSIKGLESLIQVPYGCGEQNMINFAPNVYVLQYLTRSGRMMDKIRQKAILLMLKGYQQELTYQRMDGSFSAFGNLDSSGSTWLSAFVLRCFLQSRPFITVEQTVLTSTANWLVQQQNHDGSFKEPGTVIHTELQGGLDGPVSLTAYVLMALLEDPAYTNVYSTQVSGAVTFLENNVTLETCTNYSLSLVAYALSLANSSKAKTALSELVRRADVQDGVMSWRTPGVGLVHHWQARSTDIETAAYVLLAMFTQGMVVEGLSLMKWLCRQQNHLGGYGSTQDTIIALQALSCYAALSGADAIDLRITVNTTASRNETGFQVDSNNYLLLQSQKIKTGRNMRVGVLMVGRGFVLFQLNVFYNLNGQGLSRQRRSTPGSEAFSLDIEVMADDADHLNISACARLLENQIISQTGMVLIEVGLLSGFTPRAEGIETNDLVRKVETPQGKVVIYLESVNTSEVCVTIPTMRSFKVSGVQDATVLIYDYYDPQRKARRTYNSELLRSIPVCSFCGPECRSCRATPVISSGASLTASQQHVCGHLLVLPLLFLSLLLIQSGVFR
ncbi:CD109 antigen [Scleropages formosus]|uniref:CD109 antigen n=1 Tax=Scleropages formosus TaxID=113540 RepID=UPI0010FA923B|nr:CD109 antigen [Scleropages formosus]